MLQLSKLIHLTTGITADGVDCLSAPTEYGNGNAIEVESAIYLYATVLRFNPTVVVETGTHWGYSSSFILCALNDKESVYPKNRHLYTIDSSAYEGKPEKLWANLGVSHLATHFIADSRESGHLIPNDRPIDFLWLDADHSAESVVAEWEQFAPRLNPYRALIGFHDTRLDPREAEGIKQILRWPWPWAAW